MTQSTKQSEDALTASRDSQPLGEYMKNYMRRVRSGDLGSLPIILGVIATAACALYLFLIWATVVEVAHHVAGWFAHLAR